MEVRAKLNMKPEESLIASEECWGIRAQNEQRVEQGIGMLTKALSLLPDSDDAMAYMNLMYRERAHIQCGDKTAHDSDLIKADE